MGEIVQPKRTQFPALIVILVLTILNVGQTRPVQANQVGGTTVFLPIVLNNNSAPVYLRTGISDITSLIDRCPNEDPVYGKIRNDFTILRDGVPVGAIPCSGSFTAMPISAFTDELITVQVMRIAYYMDTGTLNYLPWTSMSLYSWMTSNVNGINLKTNPGQLYCCDVIGGKKYFVESIASANQREHKRDWPGLAGTLAFFAHEIRHADGGDDHVTGCADFPDPDGPLGCDASYDVKNLGSYGVQYWLYNAWLTGYLDVGMSCSPDRSLTSIQYFMDSLNYSFRPRFVTKIPPLVNLPPEPYGGPCYAP